MIDKIIEKVRAKAAANPDATYRTLNNGPRCSYHKGDVIENGNIISHGCIFGQVLKELGDAAADADGSISGVLFDKYGLSYHDERSEWCAEVQTFQDRGTAWGKAIRFADERAWIRKSRKINAKT